MAGMQLVENPIKKTPDHRNWFGREIRGLRHLLKYTNQIGEEVMIHRENWQIIVGEDPTNMKVWGQPVRFANIDPEFEDGFLGRIKAGHHTPPQWNGTDHRFTEVLWLGRAVFLHIDNRGVFSQSYFEVRQWEDAPLVPRVTGGEVMCWYALRDQRWRPRTELELTIFRDVECSPAMFVEHETPGFPSAKLVTIPWGTERMGEAPVPRIFWQTLGLLEEGNEETVFNKNNLR